MENSHKHYTKSPSVGEKFICTNLKLKKKIISKDHLAEVMLISMKFIECGNV